MACGPCGQKAAKLTWVVDLANTGKSFPDGTARKTFALASEANSVIASLGLTGKVRPRPVSA